MPTDNIVRTFTGSFAFLSNFYLSPITYDGIRFPTVEHAFQAAKAKTRNHKLDIANAMTPGLAKRMGRSVRMDTPDRLAWDLRKLSVMRECLVLKFQIPTLRAKLIDTGGKLLVEGNTWGDRYWGVCSGEGENHLGRLLMEIRKELQNEDEL